MTTTARCLDCDRPLKDPESRDRGYGPDCWRSRRPAVRRARWPILPAARTRPGRVPGQLELTDTTEET